jgi:hypothetical protein
MGDEEDREPYERAMLLLSLDSSRTQAEGIPDELAAGLYARINGFLDHRRILSGRGQSFL